MRPLLAHAVRPAPALPGFHLHYQPALDGLRGVSILLVMAVHSIPTLVPGGFLGVDVFFVLSGFLITTLLVQEWERTGSISFRAFYLRRALRLLPALLVFLTAWTLYSTFFLDRYRALLARKGAAGALFYYGNWRIMGKLERLDLFRHTWSLSIEEQFYLLWPMLLAGLLWWKVPRKVILAVVGLGVVAAAGCRAGLLAAAGGYSVRLFMSTHLRADALLIGCLAGLLAGWDLLPRSHRGRAALRSAAWAAALFLLWHFFQVENGTSYLYYGGFTLVALAVAVLLCAVLHAPSPLLSWVLKSSILVWLGRLSYGIYLWHYPIFMTLHLRKLPLGARVLAVWGPRTYLVLHLLLAYGASLAAAALSFYGIERPLLRLKSRLPAGHHRRPGR